MKPTLLIGCFLLAGTASHAQFSLLPYIGFEQSRNSLQYGTSLSASEINGNLKAGLRADYRLKGGHSPFFNFTTSPAPVSFAFDKSGSLLNNYSAVKNNLQFRLEGGYLYSSKPIWLGKRGAAQQSRIETPQTSFAERKSCGSTTYRSRCGSKSKMAKAAPVNRSLNMRLQPSLALAYNPSSVQTVKQTANGFNYTPSWKTALVPAIGFEFAKGAQRLFTLTAFYTRPLSENDETVSTQIESKTIMTPLQPSTSSWGLTFGVPFSFTKAKTNKVKTSTEKRECIRSNYKRYMRLQ